MSNKDEEAVLIRSGMIIGALHKALRRLLIDAGEGTARGRALDLLPRDSIAKAEEACKRAEEFVGALETPFRPRFAVTFVKELGGHVVYRNAFDPTRCTVNAGAIAHRRAIFVSRRPAEQYAKWLNEGGGE